MSPYTDSASSVWGVRDDGGLVHNGVNYDNGSYGAVRPVIVLSKSEISVWEDESKKLDLGVRLIRKEETCARGNGLRSKLLE